MGGGGRGARGLMKARLGGPRSMWGGVPRSMWGAAVAAPPAPRHPHKPPELIQNPASMLTMYSTISSYFVDKLRNRETTLLTNSYNLQFHVTCQYLTRFTVRWLKTPSPVIPSVVKNKAFGPTRSPFGGLSAAGRPVLPRVPLVQDRFPCQDPPCRPIQAVPDLGPGGGGSCVLGASGRPIGGVTLPDQISRLFGETRMRVEPIGLAFPAPKHRPLAGRKARGQPRGRFSWVPVPPHRLKD